MSIQPSKFNLTSYRFGHGGFIVFWMLNWVGMFSVYVFPPLKSSSPSYSNPLFFSGLAMESMITLLSARFIPFFLLVWIIGLFFPLPHFNPSNFSLDFSQ